MEEIISRWRKLESIKTRSELLIDWSFMWNCTISEYSFQNLNEIVWRKSEKFENEAQPSFKFFTISEDDFMKILKRVRGWVQFLINNTTWQNWACLDAAFVVRHCTLQWRIWEIVNNFKLFTIASLIWIKTATVTVTISAWACCLKQYQHICLMHLQLEQDRVFSLKLKHLKMQ